MMRRFHYPLSPSYCSRARAHRAAPRTRTTKREQGIALVIAMTTVAILTVMLADMHESTSTAYAIATSERDQLQAEYMAKSGLNLTRLLIAKEPEIRQTVAPFYQMILGRQPPQLPVWKLANEILQPFCNYDAALEASSSVGIDFSNAEGLGKTPASCEIMALAENSKININQPLSLAGDQARKSLSMQLFAMMGGYHSPSPYDPLFANRDADGQLTSRLDIVSAIIDWWDSDTTRTSFDPGANEVTTGGTEDDIYQRFEDPYRTKNAPLDSLEELRLVRGIGDDFWATFVEPDPEDPDARAVTIYGSGMVNPNEAPPSVLLARVCSFVTEQPLCTDQLESAKFIQLLSTARAMAPVPFFTRSGDFLAFLEGKGGPKDLYPMLAGMLGRENPLMFRPVIIPNDKRTEMDRAFVTASRILTIRSTGFAGRSRTVIHAVVNYHDRWTPPAPNAGRMPGLGVFHYYRVD